MARDETDDLREMCEAFINEQRRLIGLVTERDGFREAGVAMQAQLDQLAAALRRSRTYRVSEPRRADPGD
jgi:hypothetical protein